jgi:carboxylesterase type B
MYVPAALVSCFLHGAVALVTAREQSQYDDDGLTVTTTSGQLTGFINSTAPWTRQFLGVPYAEPPLGSLRFQPPVRKESSDALETKAFAPSCKQKTSNSTSIYTDYEQQFLINGPDSEDCLYLNVYAPLHPTEDRLPVFVYIPGGGFTSGGANSLYKIPDKWVNKTQAHIAITINYRLNVFGFPGARAAYGNVGLLDQRAAVEWARDNAALFGGDPDRLVLWGQSAGGFSVAYYALAWPDDPIVAGLIADSGAATDKSFDTTFASFSSLAEQVGCGGLAAEDELACVQQVDAETLEHVVSTDSTLIFTPQADNVTVFASVEERIQQGRIAEVVGSPQLLFW